MMRENRVQWRSVLICCRISEELLEDALQEVGHELDDVCDDYAEALYNQEFVSVSSDTWSMSSFLHI